MREEESENDYKRALARALMTGDTRKKVDFLEELFDIRPLNENLMSDAEASHQADKAKLNLQRMIRAHQRGTGSVLNLVGRCSRCNAAVAVIASYWGGEGNRVKCVSCGAIPATPHADFVIEMEKEDTQA